MCSTWKGKRDILAFEIELKNLRLRGECKWIRNVSAPS
jgi:hypothetical protein